MKSAQRSLPSLRPSWSPFDFGLHAFLVVNPLVVGLWAFSLSPLVGGNVLVAAVLAGIVMITGAFVFGSLAERWPWTGGDYAWQTRLLDTRVGVVLALTAWWLVVASLAPIYGNLVLVEAIDPLLTDAGWDGLAGWFHERDGIFASSLVAIAVATAFVGLGMRRAALAQRMLAVLGSAALLAVLALLLTGDRDEFRSAYDEQATEIYGVGGYSYQQTLYVGTLDARVSDVDPVDTLRLVPLILLFGLWIGWAGPLAGEVRTRTPQSIRVALVRAAGASTALTLLLFAAIGRSTNWDFWNEANNLFWGSLHGTTATAPVPAWPNPVVFATWLTDSTLARIAIVAGMTAWVVGWTATLFLAPTRVLLAAASDRVLPSSLARTTGDGVPTTAALGLLVVPACAVSAVDAWWDTFAAWTSAAVLALALTTAGSGVAALIAFRREDRGVAWIAALFAVTVALVIGAWLTDPVYGIRAAGSLAFLALLYALVGAVTFTRKWRLEDRIRSEP
jgi:amino acid transporter